MKTITVLLMSAVALLTGCASSHMSPVSQSEYTSGPEEGKALVTFMRPSSFGGAVQSYLYDGEKYIGTISAGTRMCYQAEAGEHMFMIAGESTDFLRATLAPNKTYYVNVAPRMGVWTARFSLRPMNGQVSQEKIDQWVKASKEVKVNEKGEQWALKNQAKIMKSKNKYLPEWNEKPEQDKQTLLLESGI